MRVILQRVSKASVTIDEEIYSSIGPGILLLLGIEREDTKEDMQWIIRKVSNLRIFSDENGKMNRSLLDIGGEILIISQFTLFASTKKGNRPSYIRAAPPEIAVPIYDTFIHQWNEATQIIAKTGKFGADMKVELLNDGPVTIFIDSKNRT